jgi:DNA anti-recombination protein RmuC
VQTVRNGLAANAAAAQQAIANADAIDAALKGWDEESRGRWFEVSLPKPWILLSAALFDAC